MKYITAPNWTEIPENEKVVFLAGPIQGSTNWHEECFQIFKELCKLENVTIVSPKREIGMEKNEEGYREQVLWETKHLHRAAKNGVVLFWFSNEKEIVYDPDGKQRSYGKTTRTEYGEWKTRHDLTGCKVVLGLDTEWQKEKYFKTRIEQDGSNIPVCSTLIETILETINLLK